MTDDASRPSFPQARWKFERTGGGLRLSIWTAPDTDRYAVIPLAFPMEEGEAFAVIRGMDRVISWAAQSAQGTLTVPAFNLLPAPEDVACQAAGATLVPSVYTGDPGGDND